MPFLSLTISLLIIALLASCAKEEQSQELLFLNARDLPGKKVDLFQEKSVYLLSSSKGRVLLQADNKTLRSYSLKKGDNTVRFRQPLAFKDYSLVIKNDQGLELKRSWHTRYPTLSTGSKGREVAILHKKLRELGYKNAPIGKTWNEYTTLAVLAFRKSNNLGFEKKASPEVLRMLLRNQGSFTLREKRRGKYVEVDLTRQVMVLAKNGKPEYTYHISSGTAATPSDLGRYTFYSKVPGYNSIGMYYSVFYNRGEATHGYVSVPNYPASHGCIRNPIPSSLEIYNWIPLGTPIWVY